MVFQSYALWPHMSVFDNVAYPLRARGYRGQELNVLAERALALVHVANLRDLRPGRLSGGQQQRVALARALAPSDGLILFDEPLSNVDAKVREAVRAEILAMQRSVGFAAIYVTHDQTEAMELADRIVVLRGGRVMQAGTPREIYATPRSRYVATFIGIANELFGEVEQVRGPEAMLRFPGGVVVGRVGSSSLSVGEKAVAVLRPEHLALSRTDPQDSRFWSGEVTALLFHGADCTFIVRVGDADLRVRSAREGIAAVGDRVFVGSSAEGSHIFSRNADDGPVP
ncbi:MAG: ABC transporter ATP-binding protein [Acetobacteraceae bacterium]|nr:ABC transporter ATP-binding protein [Acetobacteraceae bacterium]